MKVLFVSYLFAPQNIIGALRPTKIADGLARKGYVVDVVSSIKNNVSGDSGFAVPKTINKVIALNECGIFKFLSDLPSKLLPKQGGDSSATNTTAVVTPNNNDSFRMKIKIAVFQLFKHFEFLAFLSAFKKAFKKKELEEYDVIYSSYGPLSSLLCGLYAKKKKPDLKWICEFRDPIVTNILSKIFKKPYQKIQDIACEKADAIVAVSNGYIQRICRGRYSEKTYMIPNGYDLKDKPSFSSQKEKDCFTITYVGVLYNGKRDLSPVFKAIAELIQENVINPDKLVFEYAGKESSVVASQAEKYGVRNIIHDNGVLERKACLELQGKSDVLVLSTWNDVGEEGVFPGKFLEYMLMDRPVIAVVDGNLVNSEVKQVMDAAKLGVSYEAANFKEDFPVLKEYIKMQYNNISSGKEINFNPDRNILNRYNYDCIIDSLEDLIK